MRPSTRQNNRKAAERKKSVGELRAKIGTAAPQTFDRLQETLFWLRKAAAHYHEADAFRWHVNAFLRALDEVPNLLHQDLSHGLSKSKIKEWYVPEREKAWSTPPLSALQSLRDESVHRAMLEPASEAVAGAINDRGIFAGGFMHLDLFEDSDVGVDCSRGNLSALLRFLSLLCRGHSPVPSVSGASAVCAIENSSVCSDGFQAAKEFVASILEQAKLDPLPDLDWKLPTGDFDKRFYKWEQLREWSRESASVTPSNG